MHKSLKAILFAPPLALILALMPSGAARIDLAGLDRDVKPGDDFFAYANGAWLAATEIPQGKERWGARDEINELNRQRLAKLLDDARNAPPGTLPRRVADFRAAG
jgi:predicted metalloendopeptidase